MRALHLGRLHSASSRSTGRSLAGFYLGLLERVECTRRDIGKKRRDLSHSSLPLRRHGVESDLRARELNEGLRGIHFASKPNGVGLRLVHDAAGVHPVSDVEAIEKDIREELNNVHPNNSTLTSMMRQLVELGGMPGYKLVSLLAARFIYSRDVLHAKEILQLLLSTSPSARPGSERGVDASDPRAAMYRGLARTYCARRLISRALATLSEMEEAGFETVADDYLWALYACVSQPMLEVSAEATWEKMKERGMTSGPGAGEDAYATLMKVYACRLVRNKSYLVPLETGANACTSNTEQAKGRFKEFIEKSAAAWEEDVAMTLAKVESTWTGLRGMLEEWEEANGRGPSTDSWLCRAQVLAMCSTESNQGPAEVEERSGARAAAAVAAAVTGVGAMDKEALESPSVLNRAILSLRKAAQMIAGGELTELPWEWELAYATVQVIQAMARCGHVDKVPALLADMRRVVDATQASVISGDPSPASTQKDSDDPGFEANTAVLDKDVAPVSYWYLVLRLLGKRSTIFSRCKNRRSCGLAQLKILEAVVEEGEFDPSEEKLQVSLELQVILTATNFLGDADGLVLTESISRALARWNKADTRAGGSGELDHMSLVLLAVLALVRKPTPHLTEALDAVEKMINQKLVPSPMVIAKLMRVLNKQGSPEAEVARAASILGESPEAVYLAAVAERRGNTRARRKSEGTGRRKEKGPDGRGAAEERGEGEANAWARAEEGVQGGLRHWARTFGMQMNSARQFNAVKWLLPTSLENSAKVFKRSGGDDVLPEKLSALECVQILAELGRSHKALQALREAKEEAGGHLTMPYSLYMHLFRSMATKPVGPLEEEELRAVARPLPQLTLLLRDLVENGYMLDSVLLNYAMEAFTVAAVTEEVKSGGAQECERISTEAEEFLAEVERGWGEVLWPISSSIATTLLVKVHCLVGDFGRALGVIHKLERTGMQPTVSMFNTVISAMSASEDMEGAWNVLLEMTNRGLQPDAYTASAVLLGFLRTGSIVDAISFSQHAFNQYGCVPHPHAYVKLLKGTAEASVRDGNVYELKRAITVANQLWENPGDAHAGLSEERMKALVKGVDRGKAQGGVGRGRGQRGLPAEKREQGRGWGRGRGRGRGRGKVVKGRPRRGPPTSLVSSASGRKG